MAGKTFTIEAIFKAADRMTAPILRMQKSVEGFCKKSEKQFAQLNKASDAWFAGMKAGAIGIAGGAAAAGAALAVAVKPGMEFEQAMANVGAVSLKSREEVADLEAKARELGKSTKFSAIEVANGMETMGRAGFENAQILEVIGGVLSAAAAEGAGFEEVAGVIGNTLNGMGLERTKKNVEDVADVLTLASAKTNSSILSLGESLKNVAPVAKQFGIPFKTAVTAVALLQDVGIDASEAGTATATMLTKLAQPTDEITRKMKKLGVTFQNSEGNMLPMEEVLKNFGKAAAKSGGNMKTAAFFAELVGLRGQRAALQLQEAFAAGKFTKLSDALTDAAGKADEMAKLRMDTLSGDFEQMKGAIEDVGIGLYNLKSGGLRDLTQAISKWIEENAGKIIQGVQDIITAITSNWDDIKKWGDRVLKIIEVITAVALAVKLWTGAMWLLNAAALANPFTLLVYALVAALALIIAFWPEISEFFGNIWELCLSTFEPIKAFFVGFFEFIIGLWTLAIENTMFIWEPLGAFFGLLWEGISAVAKFSFGIIATVAKTYFDIVTTVWGALGSFFAGLWHAIADTYWMIMGPIFKTLGTVIDAVRSVGQGTLGTSAETAGPSERAAGQISDTIETKETSTAELLIRDTTGTAKMSKKPTGPGITLRVQPTGGF